MNQSFPLPATQPASRVRAGTNGFNWLMAVLSLWLIGGLYLDGWAHTHGKVDQSFFTPWHAVLYSGYLACTVALVMRAATGHRATGAWRSALPTGYSLSLLGAAIFGLGGIGDFLWHSAFGIETGIEALLSPTHLMLAVGMWLITTGPLRAAWDDPHAAGWHGLAPAILSLAYSLSIFTFFTQTAHPLPNPEMCAGPFAPSPRYLTEAMGVVSMLLQTGILMGHTLFAIRRWRLPFGAFTLVYALNGLAMSVLYDGAVTPERIALLGVLMMAAGGLVADWLNVMLRPTAERRVQLRLFAFITPAAVQSAFFVSVAAISQLWWSVHMWAGMILLVGLVGLAMSYLLVPARLPAPTSNASPQT
jgi:hypothetical protein